MTRTRRLIPSDVIDIEVEAQLPDDDRRTQVFLPAVAVEIARPVAHFEATGPDTDRICRNAALLAEQAEHRQRVVASLLMLLALGLLVAAGWSC